MEIHTDGNDLVMLVMLICSSRRGPLLMIYHYHVAFTWKLDFFSPVVHFLLDFPMMFLHECSCIMDF